MMENTLVTPGRLITSRNSLALAAAACRWLSMIARTPAESQNVVGGHVHDQHLRPLAQRSQQPLLDFRAVGGM